MTELAREDLLDDFDPTGPKSILFFHGLKGGPHGTKYDALRQEFDVYAPDFEGIMDIWERFDQAEDLTRGMDDLFVVGSSFGGLLASLLYEEHPDRFRGYVLMAPAFQRGEAEKVTSCPDRSIALHGYDDEVVSVDNTIRKGKELGMDVRLVDDNHRLHDSLDLMVRETLHLVECETE